MAQTATSWSSTHALNIHELESSTLTVHPITSQTPTAEATLAQEAPALFTGAFFRATSQLTYGQRVKISFAVTEAHYQNFILIKGNLEFHRSPDMVISYNRSEGTFDVTTGRQNQQELNKFLGKISAWLDQELSFKRQLKQMMAFEHEYRAKLATVYAGGDGFTLLRTV